MTDSLLLERDSIAALGLLAHNYMDFDPPIVVASGITHRRGFNVHCCVVDNTDGEVLAIEQNAIHEHADPLEHAEQRAIRAALERLHVKRSRSPQQTVEEYYKSRLFMAPGMSIEEFLHVGCTLYNTFDPCAMCAVTLLISYMKRIVFLFEDAKFSTVYDDLKTAYFSNRQSVKQHIHLTSNHTALIGKAGALIGAFDERIASLQGVELIHMMDHCRDLLATAAELLKTTSPKDLLGAGKQDNPNQRTLSDLQRACNFPVAKPSRSE